MRNTGLTIVDSNNESWNVVEINHNIKSLVQTYEKNHAVDLSELRFLYRDRHRLWVNNLNPTAIAIRLHPDWRMRVCHAAAGFATSLMDDNMDFSKPVVKDEIKLWLLARGVSGLSLQNWSLLYWEQTRAYHVGFRSPEHRLACLLFNEREKNPEALSIYLARFIMRNETILPHSVSAKSSLDQFLSERCSNLSTSRFNVEEVRVRYGMCLRLQLAGYTPPWLAESLGNCRSQLGIQLMSNELWLCVKCESTNTAFTRRCVVCYSIRPAFKT